MIDTEAKTISMWVSTAKQVNCCGAPLLMQDIIVTKSEVGWPVLGMDQKQWIALRCAKCSTETALWKLGVPRPGHEEDIR